MWRSISCVLASGVVGSCWGSVYLNLANSTSTNGYCRVDYYNAATNLAGTVNYTRTPGACDGAYVFDWSYTKSMVVTWYGSTADRTARTNEKGSETHYYSGDGESWCSTYSGGYVAPTHCYACVSGGNGSIMYANYSIFELRGGAVYRSWGPFLASPGQTVSVCMTNSYSSGGCPFDLMLTMERPGFDTPTNFVSTSTDVPSGGSPSGPMPDPVNPAAPQPDPANGGNTNLVNALSMWFGELISEVKKLDKEVTQRAATNLLSLGNVQRGAMWQNLTNYQGAQLYALNSISNILRTNVAPAASSNVFDTNLWSELTNFHRDFVNYVTNEWGSNAAAWSRWLAYSNEMYAISLGGVGTNILGTNLAGITGPLKTAGDTLAGGPTSSLGVLSEPNMELAFTTFGGTQVTFDLNPLHDPFFELLAELVWNVFWWAITLVYWWAVVKLYWETWKNLMTVGPIHWGSLVVLASPAMWPVVAGLVMVAAAGFRAAFGWFISWLTDNSGLVAELRRNVFAEYKGTALDGALYFVNAIFPVDYAVSCLISYISLWCLAIVAHMVASIVLKVAAMRA